MAEDEQITIVGYAIMGIKVRSIFHFIIFVVRVRAYTTKHQPTFFFNLVSFADNNNNNNMSIHPCVNCRSLLSLMMNMMLS